MSEKKFKTKVEIEIEYDSEKPQSLEYESRSSFANIEYFISIDMRDWGIKDINPYASAQEIEFELELLNESTEEVNSYSFKVKVEDISIELEDVSSQICPTELKLTLKDIVKTGKSEFTAKANGVLVF